MTSRRSFFGKLFGAFAVAVAAPFLPAQSLTMGAIDRCGEGLESTEYGFINPPRGDFLIPILYLRNKHAVERHFDVTRDIDNIGSWISTGHTNG